MFSNCALRSGWCPIVFFLRAVRRPTLSFLSNRRIVRRLAGGPNANRRLDTSRTDKVVHSTPSRIGSPAVNSCNKAPRFASRVGCATTRGGRPPFFSDAPSRPILCRLEIAQTLTNGFGIARQHPRDVLDPTVAQLGGLDGRIPTSVLFRYPPQEALHLLFDLC